MEPYDFMPYYPSIQDDDQVNQVNQVLFEKKEFYELKLGQKQPERPENGNFFSHQHIVARFLASHTLYDELLLLHSPGTGKCHARDTPILMFDGTIRSVQDVCEGDVLMGDDSTPRHVRSLVQGTGDMFQVTSRHGTYVVNGDHILVLKNPTTLTITEVSVLDYLQLPEEQRGALKGYSVPVTFPEVDVELDPYLLGLWIGSEEGEIDCYCDEIATHLKHQPISSHLSYKDGYCTYSSELETILMRLGLSSNNKHIPHVYLCNSRRRRLALLAGLIDTCGVRKVQNYYSVLVSNDQLLSDIRYLCRSLGYVCWDQGKMLYIQGEHLSDVPVLYADNKVLTLHYPTDPLCSDISVSPLTYPQDYYGFSVDGNARYLLGDFTVTHNSCSAIHSIETILQDRDRYGIRKALILVKNATQIKQFQYAITRTCTNDKYYVEGETKFPNEAKHFYHLFTYATFYNEFHQGMVRLVQEYSNAVIVIDEVHDLLNTQMYLFFKEFLRSVTNRKILLLTGTPMNDNANDIALLLNLIVPLEASLPVGKVFDSKCIDSTGALTPLGEELISSRALGRVSYLKSKVDIPFKYQGYRSGDVPFPLVASIMSEHQTNSYTMAQSQDQGSFYIQSLEASLFVYPDGSYGMNGYNTHVKKHKKYFSAPFLQEARRRLKQRERMLSQIDEWSTKYGALIRYILQHQDQVVFVYMKSITGSGAIILGLCLECFGYTRATSGTNKPGLRYTILSGETETTWEDVRPTFNAERNSTGKYIQVIIGGEQVKQGLTFKSVQQIHVVTPEWNYSNLDQAIARGIRIGAHSFLPKDTPVNIYLHTAVPRQGESIDRYLYQVGQVKDRAIKNVEYLLKTVSIDCALTYERNKDPDTTKDGSRECEYHDCLYRCKGVQYPYTVPNPTMDTYQLYYSDEYLNHLAGLLEDIFRLQTHLSLFDLRPLVSKYTSFQLFQAITMLINKRTLIRNRYGFPCFLCEENNILYLVDSINKDSFSASFYTEYPVIEREHQVVLTSPQGMLQDIQLVLQLDSDSDRVRMIQSFPLSLQERFLEEAIYASHIRNRTTPLISLLLTAYAKYVILQGTTYTSTLLLPIVRKLQGRTWRNEKKATTPQTPEESKYMDMARRGKGWIGKMKQKNFNIVDVRDVLDSDERLIMELKKRKGQNCTTRDLSVLNEIVTDLGIEPPEAFTLTDARAILKKKRGYSQLTVAELRRSAWMMRGKKLVCQDLVEWFRANHLVIG
jgi:Hom_end-associated Hint/SNF2-related domain